MRAFTKVLVVFVLLLSVAFAVSQMILHGKRVNWQEEHATVSAQFDQATQKVVQLEGVRKDLMGERDTYMRDLKRERDERQADVARLDGDVKDLEGALLTKDEDLRGERLQINTMVATLEKKNLHIDTVEAEKQTLQKDVLTAEAKIKGLEDHLLARSRDIEGLQATVAQLKKDNMDLTEERNYWTDVVVRLQGQFGIHLPAEDVPIIDGKVVRVDPEMGAVVIDKGSNDKVKVNHPFIIYRDAQLVSKVTVVEVHEAACIARVAPGFEKLMVVGDDATTRMN